MPYKRYDIKNKYNRRGRRVNESMGVKIFFLIFIPLLIAGVILIGILIPYRSAMDSRPVLPDASTSDENQNIQEEVDLLRIVNDNYPLESDYKPALVPFGNVRIAQVAFDNLDRLIEDAAKEGINISLSEGYVSFDEQDKLYKETFAKLKSDNNYSEIKAESETKKICPQAGSSESQTGLLVTFKTTEDGDFANTEAGKWLSDHSVEYGFVLRYPEGEEESTGRAYAPDVYRYVSVDYALKMRAYDMTFEALSFHVNSR